MTSNHGYNTPPEGATDWHIPLNDNFKRIDTDVEIRDQRANLSNYDPKTGSKFYATDSGEIYLGDGDQWVFQGGIGESTPREPSLTLFGANRSGERVHHADFPVSQYADIGAAIMAAKDALIQAGQSNGGACILPVGQFDFDTPIEIDIPMALLGQSGVHSRSSSKGDLPMSTVLNWTGGAGPALTFRGTATSPIQRGDFSVLAGIRMEGFALTNYGGSANPLVYMDGTAQVTPGGSIIRHFIVRDVFVGGASGPEWSMAGTVFSGAFHNFMLNSTTGDGMVSVNTSDQPVGGISQLYFYNPWLRSVAPGGHSINLISQQVGLYGGTVTADNDGEGARLGYRGVILGVNFESHTDTATGCILHGSGPWKFYPATCSRWNVGLDIGDRNNPQPTANDVHFAFQTIANVNEDVHIAAGGNRLRWKAEVPYLSIVDARLNQDNINDRQMVDFARHYDTVTIPVDQTGPQTLNVFPGGREGYDAFDMSIIGYTANDFTLGEPMANDLSFKDVDVTVPVTDASQTSGATATLAFTFHQYT